jgi:alpha-glucosidase
MPQYFGQLHGLEPNWSKIEAVQSVEIGDHYFLFNCGNVYVKISILSNNLIRIRYSPSGNFFPRRSWAINLDDSEWQPTPFQTHQTEQTTEIITEKIRISVQHYPCRIECYDLQNQPFATDTELGFRWQQELTVIDKKIEPEEHFYGFGERTGFLDKTGEIKTNWTENCRKYDALTDAMYQAIPVFIALRPELSYGIFLNSTHWSRFDIGVKKPGILQMETHAPELDYYIIYGPKPEQILNTYTQLTGRMPLPPRWALGYHQCRWSYESETVVKELTKQFRTRKLPCDVIHLDIDYMQGYRVFTWSEKRFPNPENLIQYLSENGFKTVTIIDPGVKYEPEANYTIFDQGLKQNYFIRKPNGELFHGYVWPDKAVFPDFLNPQVQKWWGECHQTLTNIGIAGIWNDMNEPAIDDRPLGDKGTKITFPLDSLQGPTEEKTTHAEAHNLYGLMMAKSSAQGLLKLRPKQRSFVLTRSGYAGIQRWSSVWMGDNHSIWEHLEMSLPMLCNIGLSGVAFVGSDIGGFGGNATPELFARWMQLGILYPLMRGHSALSTSQHEPWVFGERVERICREYLELRYRLLPYLYSLFWEATQTGNPILRPLFYHYPNDTKTYTLSDQVLLGSAILAAPIYRPGIECRAVYLPAGIWYDWWTEKPYSGSQYILADAPLERMPLYVKAGSIIPLQPVMQYVDEKPIDCLTFKVFPGTGEGILYEDDGSSFEYIQGIYSTTKYQVYQENQELIIEIEPRQGQWTPPDREIIIDVVGVGEQRFQDDGRGKILRFSFIKDQNP